MQSAQVNYLTTPKTQQLPEIELGLPHMEVVQGSATTFGKQIMTATHVKNKIHFYRKLQTCLPVAQLSPFDHSNWR
jgi:hypothetical protein